MHSAWGTLHYFTFSAFCHFMVLSLFYIPPKRMDRLTIEKSDVYSIKIISNITNIQLPTFPNFPFRVFQFNILTCWISQYNKFALILFAQKCFGLGSMYCQGWEPNDISDKFSFKSWVKTASKAETGASIELWPQLGRGGLLTHWSLHCFAHKCRSEIVKTRVPTQSIKSKYKSNFPTPSCPNPEFKSKTLPEHINRTPLQSLIIIHHH